MPPGQEVPTFRLISVPMVHCKPPKAPAGCHTGMGSPHWPIGYSEMSAHCYIPSCSQYTAHQTSDSNGFQHAPGQVDTSANVEPGYFNTIPLKRHNGRQPSTPLTVTDGANIIQSNGDAPSQMRNLSNTLPRERERHSLIGNGSDNHSSDEPLRPESQPPLGYQNGANTETELSEQVETDPNMNGMLSTVTEMEDRVNNLFESRKYVLQQLCEEERQLHRVMWQEMAITGVWPDCVHPDSQRETGRRNRESPSRGSLSDLSSRSTKGVSDALRRASCLMTRIRWRNTRRSKSAHERLPEREQENERRTTSFRYSELEDESPLHAQLNGGRQSFRVIPHAFDSSAKSTDAVKLRPPFKWWRSNRKQSTIDQKRRQSMGGVAAIANPDAATWTALSQWLRARGSSMPPGDQQAPIQTVIADSNRLPTCQSRPEQDHIVLRKPGSFHPNAMGSCEYKACRFSMNGNGQTGSGRNQPAQILVMNNGMVLKPHHLVNATNLADSNSTKRAPAKMAVALQNYVTVNNLAERPGARSGRSYPSQRTHCPSKAPTYSDHPEQPVSICTHATSPQWTTVRCVPQGNRSDNVPHQFQPQQLQQQQQQQQSAEQTTSPPPLPPKRQQPQFGLMFTESGLLVRTTIQPAPTGHHPSVMVGNATSVASSQPRQTIDLSCSHGPTVQRNKLRSSTRPIDGCQQLRYNVVAGARPMPDGSVMIPSHAVMQRLSNTCGTTGARQSHGQTSSQSCQSQTQPRSLAIPNSATTGYEFLTTDRLGLARPHTDCHSFAGKNKTRPSPWTATGCRSKVGAMDPMGKFIPIARVAKTELQQKAVYGQCGNQSTSTVRRNDPIHLAVHQNNSSNNNNNNNKSNNGLAIHPPHTERIAQQRHTTTATSTQRSGVSQTSSQSGVLVHNCSPQWDQDSARSHNSNPAERIPVLNKKQAWALIVPISTNSMRVPASGSASCTQPSSMCSHAGWNSHHPNHAGFTGCRHPIKIKHHSTRPESGPETLPDAT